jgi:hypothetical protein
MPKVLCIAIVGGRPRSNTSLGQPKNEFIPSKLHLRHVRGPKQKIIGWTREESKKFPSQSPGIALPLVWLILVRQRLEFVP